MLEKCNCKNTLMSAGSIFLICATLLVIIIGVSQVKLWQSDRYESYDVISITGEAEVLAVPDIGKITFSLESEAEKVSDAQTTVNTQAATILEGLQALGIPAEDIQTQNYSSFPRYEYFERTEICTAAFCPPRGRQELVGFTVRQDVEVIIRNLDLMSPAVDFLGTQNVQSLVGPSFEIDDTDVLYAEARAEAIRDAREKAEVIADDLGVRLGKIVSFYDESENPYQPYEGMGMMERSMASDVFGAAMSPAPALSTGQERITSRITITFKIK